MQHCSRQTKTILAYRQRLYNRNLFRLRRKLLQKPLRDAQLSFWETLELEKTSFLKQLMLLKASDEFKYSINIYIDLGSRAALETDLRSFIIMDIERQLRTRYDVDIENSEFVRGVYNLEVEKFGTSIYGAAYRNNRKKYEEQILIMLSRKLDDRPTHLQNCIEHISKGRRRQVILVLDNSDQRPMQIQQDAFIVAQEFAAHWDAMVFISVRPQTFFQSKRAGALSAYPHRVFTISPPRPELVIEKRLKFALNIAEGNFSPNMLQGFSIITTKLPLFIKTLLYSIEHNPDIREILANITAGNIRSVVEFVVKFIGSANVEAEKIIRIMEEKGRYLIPIHEFSKAAILGDYSHYNPDSSMAMNLFDVQYPDQREHFLAPMILAFYVWDGSPKDNDGFTTAAVVVEEMQTWGFVPKQIDGKLRRLTNKKLIESTERITFEEDETGLIGEIPFAFRITSIEMYHIKKWAGIFAYLDAMVFDTPIFDEKVLKGILPDLEQFAITKRLDRAKAFRDYLLSVWRSSNLSPTYFDWGTKIVQEESTFFTVANAILRSQDRQAR